MKHEVRPSEAHMRFACEGGGAIFKNLGRGKTEMSDGTKAFEHKGNSETARTCNWSRSKRNVFTENGIRGRQEVHFISK